MIEYVKVENLIIHPVLYRAFSFRKVRRYYEIVGTVDGEELLVARFSSKKRADVFVKKESATLKPFKNDPHYAGQPLIGWEYPGDIPIGIAIDESL